MLLLVQAWVELHGLPSCKWLSFFNTPVKLSDLVHFASTRKPWITIKIAEVEEGGIWSILPAMLPSLAIERLRVGLPPCHIMQH